MSVLKKCVIPFVCLLPSILSLTINSQDETAEFLWKLYNIALQSKQAHNHYPYPYSYKYPGKYPEYYQKYPMNKYSQYPGSTYPSFHNKHPYPFKLPNHVYYPSKPIGYPSRPDPDDQYSSALHPFLKPKESVMDVLYSVARNDDLQCVPKLICEVTSGTISGRQQALNLPINVNMESLLGFVSVLNGAQSSPLLYFGKAALLGFSSKGNTGTCSYAYPECPSDPDKVVNYLNNHNGGFFRFFNGATGTQIPHWRKQLGEQRIQNNVVDYIPSNFKYQSGVAFPNNEEKYPYSEQQHGYRSEKTLRFPNSDFVSNSELDQNTISFSNDFAFSNELYQNTNDFIFHSHNSLKFPNDENYEQPQRYPKELLYHDDKYNLDLQRPLPNHRATPMIFPVRTGTGDLRLDPEELQDNRTPVSYQDEDVRIVFNRGNNEGNYDKYGGGFSFPER